jgi:hypothetical protein
MMKIMVIDDDPVYPTAGLRELLNRHRPCADELVTVADPFRTQAELEAHPDTGLVLVDMSFRRPEVTGLTPLRLLAQRPRLPAAIFCAPELDRKLFPYAACQLLLRPPIAWVDKIGTNDDVLRLIDEIDGGRIPDVSASLRPCYPDNPATGGLMRKLLGKPKDLEIWRQLSRQPLTVKQLATMVHYSPATIRYRFDRYVEGIVAFSVQDPDTVVPDVGAEGPTSIVGRFAAQHEPFFNAPELDDLLKPRRY